MGYYSEDRHSLVEVTDAKLDKISVQKLIHFAGIIDGEGSCGYSWHEYTNTNNGKTYISTESYVKVKMAGKRIPKLLYDNFGGQLSKHVSDAPHIRDAWAWEVRRNDEVIKVLKTVLPFMAEELKIKQANFMIDHEDDWDEMEPYERIALIEEYRKIDEHLYRLRQKREGSIPSLC